MATPVQARGTERRQALLDAVVRLLARHGARGVTHRAVAEEAGTAHGSARYYFETSEDMLAEALATLIARQMDEVVAVLADRSDWSDRPARWARFAAYVGQRMLAERDGEIARFELFLDAARSPRLQAPLRTWGETLARLLQAELAADGPTDAATGLRANALLNLMNGLMLQQLAAPRPDFQMAILLPTILDFVGQRPPFSLEGRPSAE
ncbi:TetR/AcrR family transcriptional regulator [Zavarzinia sp. CC-PAN008]|uniref:TetR/AcrR family transcriptional regulator n=1 Tax=Zavarzinia sp. CC-PAN008 TaxID=3243332 RepID=UPI003F746566